MRQDVFVVTTYVISNFHVARWWMILKYILSFSCNTMVRYVNRAGGMIEYDIGRDMPCKACELAMMSNDEVN